jgi:hypothetical protein
MRRSSRTTGIAQNAGTPDFQPLFELIVEDGQLNVHAGELAAHPPPAPTDVPSHGTLAYDAIDHSQ